MTQGQLVPLIKTAHAATLIEMLKHFEADIYPLLKAAGLPEDILQTHHEFVPETPNQTPAGHDGRKGRSGSLW